jgi:hypothetical protein
MSILYNFFKILKPKKQNTCLQFALYTTCSVCFYNSIFSDFQTIGLVSLILAIAGPEFSKDFHGGFEGESEPEQTCYMTHVQKKSF